MPDNEGNRIRRTRLSNGEVTEYTWDHRDRLTQVVTRSTAGGAITRQVNYTYDVHDQRIAKVVDLDGAGAGAATTERFVYDRGQIAMVFNNGATTPTQRYLYGTDVDQVLAEQQGTSTTTWALTDHQGTVRDLIDNTGANRNRIRYDSFGNITNQTNPALTFRFGYTGRDFDSETGLSYYRARYYDARVGRFLSEDPIGFAGGDANLYRYVGNSPANYTDPTGLVAETLLDVAMIGYDLYRIYNDNIANNCGNLGENLTSLGLNIASAALPFVPALGAIGRADDAADTFRGLENAANAGETGTRSGGRTGEDFYASMPVGRRGNHIQVPPPANRRMTIGGREYSGHSLDRMQEQGIVPSVVENAIQYGQKIPGRKPGAEVYYDSVNDVTVVLDAASGRVITADLGKFKSMP